MEYLRREDMKYALKKLDDTKFKSHEVGLVRFLFLPGITDFPFREKPPTSE